MRLILLVSVLSTVLAIPSLAPLPAPLPAPESTFEIQHCPQRCDRNPFVLPNGILGESALPVQRAAIINLQHLEALEEKCCPDRTLKGISICTIKAYNKTCLRLGAIERSVLKTRTLYLRCLNVGGIGPVIPAATLNLRKAVGAGQGDVSLFLWDTYYKQPTQYTMMPLCMTVTRASL